ncbi:hypothetical protein [Streptomyces spiramyceticus]|uniref:hypothetical protein n=1 Tax=Streptomyces spiramyceticus TaxID=299717 RepID=UPI00237B9A13|nr:hypothetical protein [Streptomyces spiramyceticus]
MFSRKKIVAVSGLLGSLVVTCTCGIQAYAAGTQGTCTVDSQGNTTCIQRTVGTPEGDGFVVRQTQSCVPLQPLSLPVIGIVNKGKKRIGPEVTCAPNTTSAPDNSDNGLDLPGLLT